MSGKSLEPPTFIDENKPFEIYEKDLRRWSRLTTLDKKLQAEMVVYKLEGHKSGIKEKINTQIGDSLEESEEGLEILLKFLEGIYKKDSMADAWMKYSNFEKFRRTEAGDIKEFIAEFENQYHLLKNAGCEYGDMIRAFKILDAAQLTDVDQKFVLTGVRYKEGLEEGSLFEQMKESLKKFSGRGVVTKESSVSSIETTLIAKGWKPPKASKHSLQSSEGEPKDKKSNYLGRKNPLDRNFMPLKCFKCKCSCAEKCNCP